MAILFVSKAAKQRLATENVDSFIQQRDRWAESVTELHKLCSQLRQQREQYLAKYKDASDQLARLHQKHKSHEEAYDVVIQERDALEERLKMRTYCAAQLQPKGKAREMILALLKGHGTDHHVLRAVLSIIESQACGAEFDATLPASSDSERAYNAGRAAKMRDLQNTIEQLVLAANQPEKAA